MIVALIIPLLLLLVFHTPSHPVDLRLEMDAHAGTTNYKSSTTYV